MKKVYLLYLIFSTSAFSQNFNPEKNYFEFRVQTNSLALNIDNLLEKISSASYSGGELNKNKLNFGFGLDFNINRFYSGFDFTFQNQSTKSFESKTNFLDIKSTLFSPIFGRNFWLKKNAKIILAAGPYFQNINLDIKPKININTNPTTLVDFISSPDVNLKEYNVYSNLGGLNTQVKVVKIFLINNPKKNAKFGISTFASINYRNQIVNNSNWKFSVSQNADSNNNNTNTNNASQSTILKFPNKHDFETSGVLFSFGLGFWLFDKETKKSNVNSLVALY